MLARKSLSEQMHLTSDPQLPMPPTRNWLAQLCYSGGHWLAYVPRSWQQKRQRAGRTAHAGSSGVPWATTALASASERRAAGTFMVATVWMSKDN
jgi:hypothetical protein